MLDVMKTKRGLERRPVDRDGDSGKFIKEGDYIVGQVCTNHLTFNTPKTSTSSFWLSSIFKAGLVFFPFLVLITTSPQCLGTAERLTL